MDSGNKSLLIRADASTAIGTGHVMRMIALAQAWRDRGGTVTIASCECPEILKGRLVDEGIEFSQISAASPGGKDDCVQTARMAQELSCKWVVLDGYEFHSDFHLYLRQASLKVLAVDDYCQNETWAVDAILNQNISATDFEYRSSVDGCRFLLGTKYALLRKEFVCPTRSTAKNVTHIQKLLLTLGGGDPDNASGKVLNLLNQITESNLEIRLLVGATNPNLSALTQIAREESPHRIEILRDVRDMPSMYRWADGVISAAGSTCWEWLNFQLPAAVVVIAENQVGVANTLARRGLALHLGRTEELVNRGRGNVLSKWVSEPKTPSPECVDGYGASRVAAALADGLWIRSASSRDIELYFDWANDPRVRQNALNSAAIDWDAHTEWFGLRLTSEYSHLFVAEDILGPVGQVRFDQQDNGCWLVDFSVAAEQRGKGIGTRMLAEAIRRMNAKGFTTLIATVKQDNPRSMAVFNRLGFTECGEPEDGLVRYRMDGTCVIL